MSQGSIPDLNILGHADKVSFEQGKIRAGRVIQTKTTIARVGLWSAVLAAVSSAAYGLAIIAVLVTNLRVASPSAAQGWLGIESFLVGFRPIQMLPLIPSLLLAPAFTAMMVSIHSHATEDKKIWSLLGLSFTLIYAPIVVMNYLIQLLPVWRSISLGETDGLAMFVSGNPHSIFWALAYAYFFMNLAMLFSAMVFSGSPLENRTRLLFILNGASGVITIASALMDSYQFYLIGSLVIWCPIFTAAAVSLAALYSRTIRSDRKNGA